jgi:paired amphipathic helix protein Sin3a
VAVAEIDPLSVTPSLVPAIPPPMQAPSTGASADDLQVFEKIRKEMGNKAQFTEFIKLVNLFNQDLITGSYCLYRANAFLDPRGTSYEWLKGMLGNPSDEPPITNAPREVSSARVSLAKCRNMGPSYRLLPKLEHNQKCSGRDELCMSVLNDEWVSHPTWESEEAGFVAHKKTQWEEALHRIEEERHDYDTNIEAVSRTIQLLEPYVINIEAGREVQVDSKLGGSSEFIYKRAIFKVYGRESGAAVIERLFTNPSVVIPHLFVRLKDVREKWKAGQRQWNEIWRQQMQANYDKSLDPQGAAASRNTDRRQFQPRTLQNEARARKDGSSKRKGPVTAAPTKEDYQFVYAFTNDEVLSDTLSLILTQIDTKTDDANIYERTKEFFDLCLGKVTSSTTDDVMEQDQPAPSIENPGRTKGRRKARSRHLAESKAPGSGSASRGTSPQAESANEAEAGDSSGAAQQINPTPRWFEPPNHPSVNQPTDGVSRPASNVQTPREDVSMAESGDKDSSVEDTPRSEYHMYCNANLYCFMRLFGGLYERLESLYNLEAQAKLAIESHDVARPAVDLGMMQTRLADQFERPAESNGNKSYYKQMVEKFTKSITQPTESSTMLNIEELLRTFWLYGGYKLYSLDRLLVQMERLAALMFSADKDRQTESLVTMFKKNATKKPATPKDDASYRKAALKLLQQGGKDKNSEETTYRVTFVSSNIIFRHKLSSSRSFPVFVITISV